MRARTFLMLLLCALGAVGGCKKTRRLEVPPGYAQARTASLDELVNLVNESYAGLETLTVTRFRVEFTGGSLEKGYLEEYPSAKGHLLAGRPDSIYVNILNPVTSSTVVTMASSQGRFQIWVPRENKFLTGSTSLELEEENPLYNVRPDHLLDAMLIQPIPVGQGAYRYFLEEDQDPANKYYVVSLIQVDPGTQAACLERKIWIERAGLHLVRQRYYDCGELVSSIDYSNPVEVDRKLVSREISVQRIREQYRLSFRLAEGAVKVNRELKISAFDIPRPPEAELVVVSGKSQNSETGNSGSPRTSFRLHH